MDGWIENLCLIIALKLANKPILFILGNFFSMTCELHSLHKPKNNEEG